MLRTFWLTLASCAFAGGALAGCGLVEDPLAEHGEHAREVLHRDVTLGAIEPPRAERSISRAERARRVRAAQLAGGERFAWRARDGGWASGPFELEDGALLLEGGEWSLALRTVALGREGSMRRWSARAVESEVNVARASDAGVAEEWVHGPLGVEHGYTLGPRPEGEGPLAIELAVDGLRAVTRSDGDVALVDAEDVPRVRYAGLFVEDASGRELEARLEASGDRLRIVVDDAQARYPIVIDPVVAVEEATLLAPTAADFDRFGYVVAISGNGGLALVGEPRDNLRGAAHVFARTGTSWSLQSTLPATGLGTGSGFGASVGLSSAGTIALVGADDGTGSVYVFTRSGSTWTQTQVLRGAAGEGFAATLAIAPGGGTALVGALGDGVGRVYVLTNSGGVWSQQAVLVPPSVAPGDSPVFGTSLALSSNGDTALIGSPLSDATASDAGAAYVFVRSGSTWSLQSTLPASALAAGDHFGAAAALTYDGSLALVGAPQDDTVASDRGTVRVFTRAGSVWSEQSTLVHSAPLSGDQFGNAIALSSDGSAAIVGVASDNDAGVDAGSARIFLRNGSTWVEEATLTASSPGFDDELGTSVAIAANGSVALAGAPQDDIGATSDAGSVHVFALTGTFGPGLPCTAGSQCASTFCVDGVCCNSACGAGALDCQACSFASNGMSDGTCTPLTPTAAAAITCRARDGECDVAETCSSTLTSCPPDAALAEGTACNAEPRGACDLQDRCAGTVGASAVCQPLLVAAGTVCHASTGDCDPAEACTGASPTCPSDVLASAGTSCRASRGDCDPAETCSGASAACPNDVIVGGLVCRASTGECDLAEACNGTDPACPPDLARPEGTSCGAPVAGVCDAPDTCEGTTGATAVCAARWLGPEVTCRQGSCMGGFETLPETCTGSAASCAPPHMDACDPYVCGANACLTSCTGNGDCTSGRVCVASACVVPGADAGLPDAGPPDAGPPDAGSDADVTDDAGTTDDAAVDAALDAAADGGGPTTEGGCSCRVAHRTRPTPSLLAGLVLLALWRRRRAA